MANQYTKKELTEIDINEIVSLYKSGMSFTKIGIKLHKQKNTIKNILIEKNIWVESRDKLKKEFNNIDINKIINLYLVDESSCNEIGKIFGVSKTPIQQLLKNLGILRIGKSDGVKINLTEEQECIIKKMYLVEYKSYSEISKKTKLSKSFIQNYLYKIGQRRTKSEGASVGGVKKYRNVLYSDYLAQLPEYEKYRKKVLSITNKQPISMLENYNKRGTYKNSESYHLDHKFSIMEGFKNNILPEIIGDIKNLEFLPWKENLKKRAKCSITINELINL
jgi:transposase